MKTLIVEDDFTSRVLLQEILKQYGTVHIAVNGKEAVHAVNTALQDGEPYELICLDIMMPEMDGYQALSEIRGLEESQGMHIPNGSRVFMTTALHAVKNVIDAFSGSCDAYLLKPIEKAKLLQRMRECGLST